MEYHILPDILQMNLLIWLYTVKIIFITLSPRSQWMQMKKDDAIVMNEFVVTNCHIACLHELRV